MVLNTSRLNILVVDVPEEYQGIVMEHLGKKKAEMKHMVHYGDACADRV